MKDNFGRAIGTCIVGLGLLAFVISAPATDTPRSYGGAAEDAGPPADQAQPADRMAQPAGASAASAAPQSPAGSQPSAQSVIARWTPRPRRAARRLIEKYGEPNEISDSRLTWFDNGPWRKTVVYRDELEHNFPSRHYDFIEQSISYRVPPEKFNDLARLDGSLTARRTAGLLSSRSDSEAHNFLALNLANDVIRGNKGVDEARQFFAKTEMLLVSGKSTPYTEGLLFRVDRLNAADPDQPAIRPGASQGGAQGLRAPGGVVPPSRTAPPKR